MFMQWIGWMCTEMKCGNKIYQVSDIKYNNKNNNTQIQMKDLLQLQFVFTSIYLHV